MNTRPPLPPFTRESAIEKVRLAEDGWNSRDPAKVALAYTLDTQWRNRAEFATNREEARAFLERKWKKELDYRLIKELWAFTDNRIAVRYAYEWHDDSGNWFRSYGNENWEFEPDGLMKRRFAWRKRYADKRIRAPVPLAAGQTPGRSPFAERSWLIGFSHQPGRIVLDEPVSHNLSIIDLINIRMHLWTRRKY